MSNTPNDHKSGTTGAAGEGPSFQTFVEPDIADENKGETLKPKPFDFRNPPRRIGIKVLWPRLLGANHEPIIFKLRIALSGDMQKQIEEAAALSQEKQVKLQKAQMLDELCDLLTDRPTGLAGFPEDNIDPGLLMRRYVGMVREHGDNDSIYIVEQIIRAANNGYWAAASPQSFSYEV